MISRKERHDTLKKRNKNKLLKRIPLLIASLVMIAAAYWLLVYQMDLFPNDSGNSPTQHHSTGEGNGEPPNDANTEAGSGNGTEHAENEVDAERPDEGGQSDAVDMPGQAEGTTPDDANEEKVSFAFVGDLMMATTVANLVKEKGYDYPFQHVKEYLQQPDLTVANLETPITERGEPQDKQWVYRTSPDALPAIVDAGFDVVNIANNHILDYGEIGFLDTLDELSKADLPYVGGGRDEEEAFRFVTLERNGLKVAFLGFSLVVPNEAWKAAKNHPGVAPTYDYRKPVEAIEAAREEADLVVVIAHWGIEREPMPEPRQTEMARRYIDAGADLVVGSHPHVLQGAEQYDGKWIVYSLGNFVFTTNAENPATWDAAILNATCTKNGDCDLSIIPIDNRWALPRPLEGEEASRVLRHFDSISLNAHVDDQGNIKAAD